MKTKSGALKKSGSPKRAASKTARPAKSARKAKSARTTKSTRSVKKTSAAKSRQGQKPRAAQKAPKRRLVSRAVVKSNPTAKPRVAAKTTAAKTTAAKNGVASKPRVAGKTGVTAKNHLAHGNGMGIENNVVVTNFDLADGADGYRPSEREPFMNERQRDYFRLKLLTWREDILREAKDTIQHLQDENQNHPDIADRASSETDRAIELRARDRQRKLISKIDAAVGRIDDGTYGFCEETGDPISLKRLEARPIATLSIEAQERHERRERVYRDD